MMNSRLFNQNMRKRRFKAFAVQNIHCFFFSLRRQPDCNFQKFVVCNILGDFDRIQVPNFFDRNSHMKRPVRRQHRMYEKIFLKNFIFHLSPFLKRLQLAFLRKNL